MPNRLTRAFNSIGGSLMARCGRVGILGTTGAKTGLARRAPIGFVHAAGRDDPPRVRQPGEPRLDREPEGEPVVHVRDQGSRAPVPGPPRRSRTSAPAALAELKAKMGGMAERATWGDLFVLEPEA